MKVSGIRTREMDGVWRDTPMVIGMRVISRMENQMAMESLRGLMGKYMKASGLWGLKKARVYGRAFLVIRTLGSGSNLRQRDTVYISGKMEIDMRVNGLIV